MAPSASSVASCATNHSVDQLDLFALLAPRIAKLGTPLPRPLAQTSLETAATWPFSGTSRLLVEPAGDPVQTGALTASVFDAYRPTVRVPGSRPHPTRLVESAAMAAASVPPCFYRPTLPEHLVESGALSDAQLEAVCRAGDAHGTRMPGTSVGEDGPRQGFFVGDATGVGKGRAQPLCARVLTSTGWKLMGEVHVGDLVVSDDGRPTRVTGVFPQGEMAVYRVTFSDGSATECTDDHLWLTQTKRQRYYQKKGWGVDYPKPDVRTLREIRESLHLRHSVPLVAPVEFEAREVPLDPYLLGVMIGDGCIRKSAVQLTLGETEMVERTRAALPKGAMLRKVPSRDYHYDVTAGTRTTRGLPRNRNPVVNGVRALGLCGKRAWEKWVPEDYLFNTVDVRLAVLRGLMDSDGYASERGVTVHYTTSERLADDVAFLVQSLGGVARKRVKKTPKRDCYATTITLTHRLAPFRLRRKAERCGPREKYPARRYLQSVEYAGEMEAQCIAVEAESRLYVTDDFIVTHNTSAAILLDNILQGRRRALWVSENRNLMRDAVRDWTALGGPADFVFDLGACKGPIPRADGICFASYDTLKGKPRERDGVETGIDRLEQVIAWLSGGGEEAGFEGVVVFDESHNMASALDRQGSRGIQKASQRALVGVRPPGEAPERARRLRQRDGGHRSRQPRLRHPPGALGPGHPVPDRRGVCREGVRRRHRGDGAGGEGPEVDGALPRPVRLLRRRRLPDARPRPRVPPGADLRPLRPSVAGGAPQHPERARGHQGRQVRESPSRGLQPVLGRPPAVLPARAGGDERAEPDPGHGGPTGGGRELRRATRLHDGGGHRAGLRQGRQEWRRPPGPRRDPARPTPAVRRGQLPDHALRGVRGR